MDPADGADAAPSEGLADQPGDAREAIERRLATLIPLTPGPERRLAEAARYALLGPGKRLRPRLTLAATAEFGGAPEDVLDLGCAFELVHAASLMLDDLPSMDDAALRRGRPAAHLAFGEDLAVLGAVALLARAFGVIAGADFPQATARLELVARLSATVGLEGLTAGQTLDLHERGSDVGLAAIERLNRQKTGVLFALAAEAGACAAGATEAQVEAARTFGERLGAAFQIRDDILDVEALAAATGKDAGQDASKPTMVSLLGPVDARARARAEVDAAVAALDGSGPLAAFARSEFGEA